ncbi:MAG TPA: MBL fold metallo-hydrolase [Thermoplasmata archaeon]|nr:MBL fold metallo-hydrolase [Thermoplasmata archaeon]
MKIKFLGGASEVGRLGMLFSRSDRRILLDYGMLPTTPPQVPRPAPPVEATLLTHAHLDHSGMIPWVTRRCGCPVWATEATAAVSHILASDSQKIADAEGYDAPFSPSDVDHARELYDLMEFGEVREWDGVEVEALFAGHIPGATMFRLRGDREVVFTGDISVADSLLIGGTEPVSTDVLIIESTYASREHPERRALIGDFLEKVDEVVERGGHVIVPAFAVGRSQEILMMMAHTGYEVWFDGLGRTIADLYLDMPRFLKEPGALRRAMREARWVRNPSDRKRALQGDVIVTTSGMLDGGPVLEYANQMNSPDNAILLTGYQVEGTNGRLLVEERALDIAGAKVPIRAEVVQYDFSAHAGHSELISFIERSDPDLVVLMHGDDREALARDLTDHRVLLPDEGRWYEL